MVFDGGVLILNTFGTVVAAEPERPEILGQDWSNRAYFRQMVRSPGLVFSDIVTDGPQGLDVIVVAVPITGEQGEFLGAMVGMFRLGATTISAFYGSIVKLRIGESGNTYLVDSSGRVIYHSDADYVGQDFSSQAVVQHVLNGETGAIRTRDFDGRDIVAGFAPVPGMPWGSGHRGKLGHADQLQPGLPAISACAAGVRRVSAGPGCRYRGQADHEPNYRAHRRGSGGGRG